MIKLKVSDEKRDFGILKIRNTTQKAKGVQPSMTKEVFNISKIRNTPLKSKSSN
jgi:hypothetical protein